MRKPRIHPVKSDRYISLLITTSTAASGKCLRFPKIMFLFIVAFFVGIGFFLGSVRDNFNNEIHSLKQDVLDVIAQKELVEEEKADTEAIVSEKDSVIAGKNDIIAEKEEVISGKDIIISEKNEVISELLNSISEKEAQLNSLELQTQDILNKIKTLEAIRDSIYEKLYEIPEDVYTSESSASVSPNKVSSSSSPSSSSVSNATSTLIAKNDTFDEQFSEILATLESIEKMLDENYEAMNTLSEMSEIYEYYISCIPSGWPLENSRITSPFGYRTNPLTGVGIEFHDGIDFSAKYKQELYATAPGTVTFAGFTSGYGYNIVIDHGYGYSTRYAHCTKLLFKKGDTVSKGECIALAGSTGRSTAVHLHYEVLIDGKQVDPADYLD